ncbi:hypothetical protein FMUND_11249 [Fusarium mundagurra]|uniref:Heterokaryon incompatibility domain-containing protein n=1 Tax=Fusarium mundagurra TaxID=1567541 RepID=A0A8H5Y740_9HYPO|nr:hypothetical protein FMUND_11249 [Fusarium mundagurra]
MPNSEHRPVRFAVYVNWFFTQRKVLKHPVQTDTIVLFIDSENGTRKPLRRRHMGHVIAIEPSLDSIASLRPRIIRNEVNYESFGMIKGWMTYCRQNHLEVCKSDKLPTPRDFKVIRCCDSEIISAPPGCNYAALSYVWGDIEYPDPNDHNKFPRVVVDSIKVASELGCHYLWVDRHCIDQKDPDKKKQIQRMDEIYSQADFTIIDASGTDCTHGLSGVRASRRLHQPHGRVRVNGVNLIYLGTPPTDNIQASRWASRGWTYQEGVLSRKRIFFTNEQVIFQCNTMTCQESFSLHMDALHSETQSNKRKKPTLLDTEPISLIDNDIGEHLMEFSKRDLKYDKDSLDAFLGILNVYQRNYGRIHLLGNPLNERNGNMINAWYHPKPGTRKFDFPSWSWTGWKGAIKMTSYKNWDPKLRLVTTNGDSIPLDEYVDKSNPNYLRGVKPVIEMRGRMTKLSFEFIKWGSEQPIYRNRIVNEPQVEDGPWAILPLTEEITCYSFLYLDNEALAGLYQYQLPVMVLQLGTTLENQYTIILALRETGDAFERVGLIIIRDAFESDVEKWNTDPRPNVYKDRTGKWITRAPIPEPQDPIWLQETKEMTIRLQ